MDDIREAQSADDSLQPVMQALKDLVKPLHGSLQDYPEEARILFSQWDSLVLATTTLTAPLRICKSCCQLGCDDRIMNVFSLTLDTLEGQRPVWRLLTVHTFQDGSPSLECLCETVLLATCTSEATSCHARLISSL